MRKYKYIVMIFFVGFINAAYAKNTVQSCGEVVTKLTVSKKNDFNLISKSCDYEENPFIMNFLINGEQKIFINKYSVDGGKWPQKLEAVSVYKQKNKPPVLITLHTQRWDTPTINGLTYSVNLYKITNNKDGVELLDISTILGNDQSGLEGVSDDYMHFKFKDIASIKKWLDKNY